MAQRGASDPSDMGNINKPVIKPGRLKDIHQKIRILNFRTLIDNIPTRDLQQSSNIKPQILGKTFSVCRNLDIIH